MKYLDLLEQIELVEAAKDKYTPMFSFFDQIAPGLEHPQTFKKMIEEHISWATRVLSNSDRIVWYLRYVRLYVLSSSLQELKTLYSAYTDYDPAKYGQPNLTDDPKAEEAFFKWLSEQEGRVVPEASFNKTPPIGKKSLLSKYTMFTGLPIPTRLWKQAFEEVMQFKGNIEGIIQRTEKLYARDFAKMNQNSVKDSKAYAEELAPKKEALEDKYMELRRLCLQDPDNTDCGNTFDELESRYNLAKSLHGIAIDYIEDNSGPLKSYTSNMYSILSQMQQFLAHAESINYEPMKELQFGWKMWGAVGGVLRSLEDHWQSKASRIVAHDSYYEKPQIEKIIDFGDGMAWFNLHRAYCDVEGKAMGHCGNEYDNMRENDEVLSLRQYIGKNERGHEEWKPHLTFIYDTDRGKLSEMKGYKNHKPEARYHRYIVPLLQQDWIEGIYTRRGQHEKENNFFISDLPEEIARKLAAEKPALVTRRDMDKLGVEGDPEQEDEDPTDWNMDQINEQLDEWGIENIEEMDESLIVLSSLGDTEKAYTELSGESWPSENDVDYIDPEQQDNVLNELPSHILRDLIEYTVHEYTDDVADEVDLHYDEEDEDTEYENYEEYLEELEGILDGSDALHILQNASDSIIDQNVQQAWEQYHAAAMQSEAENIIDSYANEYIERGAEIQWMGSQYAITIDRDTFFQDIWEDLEGEGGSGTTYWTRIFNAYVPPVTENYWEGLIYGDPDYAYSQIAREVASKMEDDLQQEKYRRRVNKLRDEEFKKQQAAKAEMEAGE